MHFHLFAILPYDESPSMGHTFSEEPNEPREKKKVKFLVFLFNRAPCAIVKVVSGLPMYHPS